jgi:hypothetical protein
MSIAGQLISTSVGLADLHIGHHMVFVYIKGITSAHNIVFL